MSSSRRFPLLFALAVAVALPTATATALTAQDDGEAGEILLEVPYSWTLKGSTLRGTVTNSDPSDVSGTAKVTRTSSGKTVTLATGGKLAVAAGHKQVLSLSLTKTGKSFFRRHTKASANLVLRETAGTRTGEVSEEIRIRKAR